MSTYSEYALHVQTLDRAIWLGMLSWYSVADSLSVTHTDLAGILRSVGLDSHVPNAPHDSDVFKRAASAAQRKKIATNQTDVFLNFLVRDPGPSKDTITRRVVREQVRGANERLGYEEVAEITFDKKSGDVGWRTFEDDATARDICTTVKAAYESQRGCLSGYAVRELIRQAFIGANATNVRYPVGGVYFLAAEHAAMVAGLQEMANALGSDVSVHSLPLIDDASQRDMLREAFEAESVGRAHALVTELIDLKASGKPLTPDKYATYVTAMNDLKGKVGEYSTLLETSLGSASSALSILQRQVLGLLGSVQH